MATTRADTLRSLLRQSPMNARQLADNIGISQPTLSRELKAVADEVVRIGAGPSIQYALYDRFRGFSSAPVYRISEAGQVSALGRLVPVYPHGFVMQQTDGKSIYSDSLPWWLFDMRPQGYLGRAYASRFSATLGLPANPEHWNDAEVIRSLLAHGADAIGNLLIGEQAREQFLNMQAPVAIDRDVGFPALAKAASSGEIPGSSAGGEQPKFCTFTDRGHVLVKFSAADNHPVSERWRDLLAAEHLSLKVLGVETDIFDFSGQRFLEIPRFDRVGKLGRIGLFSLRALDAEFTGRARESWPVLVEELIKQKHVEASAAEQVALLWAYGTLTGNTDMHHGNLSFISSHGRPYHLAPAYDILPMGFAPKSGGELVNSLRAIALPEVISVAIWHQALELAEQFVSLANDSSLLSENFKPCLQAFREHLDDAARRIARLA